jgi:adenosylcobinamide kinase/adenosylcobinamide-phosphate guanylyltransferase
VLGGARSGKTRHALELAEAGAGRLLYLATAEARDAEMRARIERHRTERGPRWQTVEEPLDLPGTLAAEAGCGTTVLVDCLTLWLSNLMEAGRNPAAEADRLARLLPTLDGRVILVSNEVGLGIVPDTALARRFRDEAGRMNQAVARAAERVLLVVAGLPLTVK